MSMILMASFMMSMAVSMTLLWGCWSYKIYEAW